MMTFEPKAMPRRYGFAVVSVLIAVAACDRPAGGQSAAPCPPTTVIPIAPPSPALSKETPSPVTGRFSFIVYGDTRGPYDGRALQPDHAKVVGSMISTIKERAEGPEPVRFILQTGDAVTDGRVAAQWNASYNPLINRLTVGAGVSYYLAVGNHDVTDAPVAGAPGRVIGLCNYFAANDRLIPREGSPHRMKDYPTFGFGYGNTFFLTFDTVIPDDTAQFSWVKSELERLDRRLYPNVVVFVHQPPLSSGPHGGPRIEPATATLRTFFMPLFRRHHVRIVFSGHDHLFEHWVERYRDSTGTHRLDQIVTGGGGAPPYAYSGEPDLRDYLGDGVAEQLTVEHLARPSADVRKNPLHFVLVTVNGADIRLEVVGVDRGRGFAPYGGVSSMVLADPMGGGVPRSH